MERFKDRYQAGKQLAEGLRQYQGRSEVWVFGLPRGGVPVAYEVAKALKLPLDLLVVRKLGTPGQEELAMGAIASGGARVLNQDIVDSLRISPATIDAIEARERQKLQRREKAYRGDKPFPKLEGQTVILVDDGLATGATMKAAVTAIKTLKPAKVVVAVPVAPPDTCQELALVAEEVVALRQPPAFFAVGAWYEHFPQTSDQEVLELLKSTAKKD